MDILPVYMFSNTGDPLLCRLNRDLENNLIETIDVTAFAGLSELDNM